MSSTLNAMDIFKNISSAKMTMDGNYEREGRYLWRIDAVKMDKNRKGDTFLAVEKTCIKVLSAPEAVPNPDPKKRPHAEGEAVCHMMMAKHDSFLGNVKSMIAHILEMRPEDITAEDAASLCAPEQLLTGMIVETNNRTQLTKAKTEFTVVNYIRRYKATEALSALSANAIAAYFPNNALQKLAAYETAEANKAATTAA